MLAQQADELFGTEALVALEMPDDADLTGGIAVRKCFHDQARTIFRAQRDLRKNGNADAQRHQGFHGRDLSAAVADLGLEIVIAAETVNLAGETAAASEQDPALVDKVIRGDLVFSRQWVRFADHELKRFFEKRLDGDLRIFDGERDDGQVEFALEDGLG